MICWILHVDFGEGCWGVINLTLTVLHADLVCTPHPYSIKCTDPPIFVDWEW
jgi:hypothetical protein